MCRIRWAVLLVPLLTASAARADDDLAAALALQRAIQEAIRKAEPSVVCILVSRSDGYKKFEDGAPRDYPGRLGKFDGAHHKRHLIEQDALRKRIDTLDLSNPDTVPESYGSGVVIDRSGLILTNAHVVRGATKVFVRLPGGAGSYADIHALDSRGDLAVLRLIDPVQGLKPVTLGDGGAVQKGQFVVALSNPFAAGFRDGSPSASRGVISNLRRRLPGLTSEIERKKLSLHHFGTLIQTDARLGLGCSGGALVNLKGELIGLLTAKAALTGVETPGGFALPVDDGLKRIIAVLRRGEEVEYGFLGVTFTPDAGRGVRVRDVIGNSPAERAGLRPGEYLLSVGGRKVRNFEDVFLAIGTQLAGAVVAVEHGPTADGPARKSTATLAKYHVPQLSIASKRPPAVGGLRVDHASLLVQRGGFRRNDGIPEGVLVREVVPDSPADQARLRPDQVITAVDGRRVNTPAEFYRAMARARGDTELTLGRDNGGEHHVTLKLE